MSTAAEYKPGSLPYPEQDDRKGFFKYHYKGILIILIPLLFAPILLGHEVLAYRYIYITICAYLYLVFNVMAPGSTAFLYIVFMPPLGVATSKALCMSHYTDLIFLLYGSLWMGIMMDISKLSERLSIIFLKVCGYNLKIIQLVLMIITAVLSFLINSTFIAAFMMKIAQGIMRELNTSGIVNMYTDEEPYERGSKPYPSRPAIGIYLTTCFAATLGAMPSPFQDPNGVLVDVFKHYLPNTPPPTALSFIILFGAPMLFGLIVLFLWINIIFLGLFGGQVKRDLTEGAANAEAFKEAIRAKREEAGPWSTHTKLALALIILSMLIIVLRRPLIFPGWYELVKRTPSGASVAAIGMATVFFAVPANYLFCRYYICTEPSKVSPAPSVLNWKVVNANTPWALIFFLGAACAAVFCGVHSKFYVLMRDTFVRMNLDKSGGLLMGSLFGMFLSMLSPATNLARFALPQMLAAGYKLNSGAGSIAVPFATSLHNQFMLPCSTAANTIIAGWGNVRPFQFLIGGLLPTICMFSFILLFTFLLGQSAIPGYDSSKNAEFNFTTPKPA